MVAFLKVARFFIPGYRLNVGLFISGESEDQVVVIVFMIEVVNARRFVVAVIISGPRGASCRPVGS